MSNIDKEYYEYLNKLDKEELITKVMNLESQNNELSNENYELGRENVKLKSGELVSPEVAKQSFEMRDKALGIYEEKLKTYKRMDAVISEILVEQSKCLMSSDEAIEKISKITKAEVLDALSNVRLDTVYFLKGMEA